MILKGNHMESSGVLWDQEHSHPPEEVLERYAMSRTDPEQTERIEEHILFCSECRDALDEADRWVAIMKCALPEPDNPSFVRSILSRLARFVSLELRDGTGRFSWSLASASRMALAFAGLALLILLPARALVTAFAPQQQVALVAMRGADPRMEAVAGRPFRFILDVPGQEVSNQPGNRLEIVSSSGIEVWSCALSVSKTAEAPALKAGNYWIRILASNHEPLKEYGLIVR
jgi:hypothetical protein